MPITTLTEIRNSVRVLKAQGHSLREISRLLKLSRNTVRRILPGTSVKLPRRRPATHRPGPDLRMPSAGRAAMWCASSSYSPTRMIFTCPTAR
jgi:transposase